MKKTLSALIVLTVLSCSIIGALSVLPHVHGKDFNHSQHETCPVHQFGLSHVHADVFHVDAAIGLFLFCFLIEAPKAFVFFTPRIFARLRAPPTAAFSV